MSFKSFVSQHKTDLSFGLGLACYAGAIFEVVRATIRATRKIDAIKRQIAEESMIEIAPEEVKLPVKEVVKAAAPEYICSAALLIVSAGSLIYGKGKDNKDKSDWMNAYFLTKGASDLYKESAAEIVGENKEKKIREHAAEKSMQQTQDRAPDAECTGDGNTLYYIPYLGMYIRSTPEMVNGGILKF